jgi:carboxylesterase type B
MNTRSLAMMSLNAVVAIALLAGAASASAQNAAPLRQYLIEREIKGAGNMTPVQLQDAARKSNGALRALGPDIQWVHSYVAGDKIYCVYNAPSESLIKAHAEKSGFPADKITPVAAVIDPTTAR